MTNKYRHFTAIPNFIREAGWAPRVVFLVIVVGLSFVTSTASWATSENSATGITKESKSVPVESSIKSTYRETRAVLSERLAKTLRDSSFKNGDLGIWVGGRAGDGIESYFAQNAEKAMVPASLSKLVTAGAILNILHPGHQFRTELVVDSPIKNGVLSGPLYLKGGGDPSFVSENMWFLVNELTRNGVTSIQGDIVVDDSRFDAVRFDEDRQKERVDRAYDAPIGAMSMNWNSVTVYVRPGEKVGDQLKVYADVASPYIKVINKTRTVAQGRGQTVSVERRTEKNFIGDVLEVSGSMALGHNEVISRKSISKPDLWAGYNLVEFLKQRGIVVSGTVRTGEVPSKAITLAYSDSKPLSAIVADMSKWSNNYVAEMLVKNLAYESGILPGNMAGGIARIRSYLEGLGFIKNSFTFVNPAGLTRDNRMTPAQLGRFLELVRQDFRIFPEYLASLPIGGVDGTLRSRMKNTMAERWVRAKTGLLTGVVGLSGYAGRSNGEIISFAFIYNGAGREDRARALFDKMAGILVEE